MRIGLALDRRGGPSEAFLRGIAAYVRPHRPWVLTWESPSRAGVERLIELGVVGIIGKHLDGDCVALMREHRIAAVGLGPVPRGFDLPVVANDDAAIGELGATHFLNRGYKHFAYYARQGNNLDARGTAFAASIAKAGHSVHLFEAEFGHPAHPGSRATEEAGVSEEVRQKLCALPKPLAVFCVSDNAALIIAEHCRELELVVPHEVAILGVDNDIPVCELAFPPLSSVQTAAEQIGFRAAELLDQMLATGSPAASLWLPPVRVVTRRSTDTAVSIEPWVQSGLSYLREHLSEPTCVPDVFDELPCSRRTLERKFVASIGLSPAQAWMRFRLEEAQRLLAETDRSVEEIAQRSGFSEIRQLQVAFRKIFGQTPTEFRRHANPALRSGK